MVDEREGSESEGKARPRRTITDLFRVRRRREERKPLVERMAEEGGPLAEEKGRMVERRRQRGGGPLLQALARRRRLVLAVAGAFAAGAVGGGILGLRTGELREKRAGYWRQVQENIDRRNAQAQRDLVRVGDRLVYIHPNESDFLDALGASEGAARVNIMKRLEEIRRQAEPALRRSRDDEERIEIITRAVQRYASGMTPHDAEEEQVRGALLAAVRDRLSAWRTLNLTRDLQEASAQGTPPP